MAQPDDRSAQAPHLDPASTSLALALDGPDDIGGAAARFGRSRYHTGSTHAEVLADLDELMSSGAGTPSDRVMEVIRHSMGAWMDAFVAESISWPYRDALTGLPTVGFLSTMAAPMYRDLRSSPGRTHSLAVVRLDSRPPTARRLPAMLSLVRAARLVFEDALAVGVVDDGVVAMFDNARLGDACELALQLGRAMLGSAFTVEFEPMPPTVDALESRLLDLAGRGLTGRTHLRWDMH